MNRRVGNTISFGGAQYNIVAITEDEVVLSASSGKKTTIKYNIATETR
jgi:Lhr-like helicase